jgi:uridine phosphorylase
MGNGSGEATGLPILGVLPEEVASRAVVVGDPARVADVTVHLEDAREIGRSREYVTWTGRFDGVPVTVGSHGVGSAGAAICFEELARAGVRRIVRAGTCGGLQTEVVDGDLVVGTAAVRDDGLTDRFVPPEWPAAADPALTLTLAREATGPDRTTHVGVVHTAANFYPGPLDDEPRWRPYHRAGALAVEMEFAALLVIAQLHRIAAGGVFAVDGNLLDAAEDMSDYDPDRAVVDRAKEAMVTAALRALVADAR